MDCGRIRDELIAFLDGELEGPRQALEKTGDDKTGDLDSELDRGPGADEVRAHLASCPSCRGQLERARRVARLLADLPRRRLRDLSLEDVLSRMEPEETPAGQRVAIALASLARHKAPEGMLEVVRAGIVGRPGRVTRTPERSVGAPRPRPAGVIRWARVAAAAVLLVATGVLGWELFGPHGGAERRARRVPQWASEEWARGAPVAVLIRVHDVSAGEGDPDSPLLQGALLAANPARRPR